jgi:hypothetical protein
LQPHSKNTQPSLVRCNLFANGKPKTKTLNERIGNDSAIRGKASSK